MGYKTEGEDFHTHFQCLDFVKHLKGRTELPKAVLDGGSYIIECAAGLDVPSLPKIIDIEQNLRDMDDMEVDVAVLSHGIPFGPDVLGGQEADDWAARIDDVRRGNNRNDVIAPQGNRPIDRPVRSHRIDRSRTNQKLGWQLYHASPA